MSEKTVVYFGISTNPDFYFRFEKFYVKLDSPHVFGQKHNYTCRMATSADKQSEQKCPICFEEFHTLRKLPGCTHSFCETCVLSFVSDLKNEDKLGSEFECPVCRLPSQAPGNNEALQRWIISLEINKELDRRAVSDHGELQDCNADSCSQCQFVKKTSGAIRYCLTCQELYCSSCSDTLHAFKVNINHTIIDTDNKKSGQLHTRALKMLKEFITCSVHPEAPVTLYCEDDKVLCCISCSVDSHKNCQHVKPIGDLKQRVLDSPDLVKLSASLQKHIEGVLTTIKVYDAECKEQTAKIAVEFQNMKHKVIKLLDVMEDNLNQEGKAAVKDIAIKTQDEIDEFYSMRKTLDAVHYLLENFMKNMSSEQMFACIHEAEQILEGIEMKLIKKGEVIKSERVALTATEKFEEILNLGPNETSQLASISQTEATISLPRYKDRPFWRKHDIKKVGMYNILPTATTGRETASTMFTPKHPTYSGLQFIPDNKILLVDSYYGFWCLVAEDFTPSEACFHLFGSLDKQNYFSNERHATFVRDGVIAVSIPAHKKIIFMTADRSFAARGEIKCECKPRALCGLENGDIAVAWDEPVAFGILSGNLWNNSGRVYYGVGRGVSRTLPYREKVYFYADKSGRKLQSFQYIAVDEKRRHIIQPCHVDKAVYCFDYDGKPEFKYTSETLEYPRGVALDREGNIYVCETYLGYINIISPEGQAIFAISEGVPSEPISVGFNKNNDTLAVTQLGGSDGRGDDLVHLFFLAPKPFPHP